MTTIKAPRKAKDANKISTFESNITYEVKMKPLAIEYSKEYVALEVLGCAPEELEYREATVQENKNGVDVIFWHVSNPNHTIAVDYKIRRNNVEKYWKGTQDCLVEHIQNKALGWCKQGKDIHVVWVFPWITEDSEYLPYYGCHMSICAELLEYAEENNIPAKRASNGYTWTSFYLFPVEEVAKRKSLRQKIA